jgi:tetratricopeptide (TPR) repeat protein
MILLVSSDWTNLIRLIHKSEYAIDSGDILTASLSYAQAADYSPEKYQLLENAGILAMKAGNPAIAKSYLMQVYNASNISASGLEILGNIAQLEEDVSSSITFWEAAIAVQDNEQILIKLIHAYRHIGDWENVLEYQRELIALNPSNAEYNYQLGLILAVIDPQAAIAYLSLASELDESIKTFTNSFVRNLRSALNRDDPSYPFMIAGQELASIGEWELALVAFTNARDLNPDYADAWAYLGESLQKTGKDGYKELQNALRLDPESVAVNSLMGIYWQRQDRYDLALVYLYAATSLDEDNPALQVEIGNTLGLMGNIPAAESHYRRAVSLDPDNPTYWNSLANYYIRYEVEIKEKGAAAARQAVILSPENPISLDILAQIYLLQNHPTIAQRFLDRALSADPKFAPAHLHSGLVSILDGDQLAAYQHFTAAISYSQAGSPINDQARRLLETYFP